MKKCLRFIPTGMLNWKMLICHLLTIKKLKSALASLSATATLLFVLAIPANAQFFAKGADIGWLSQMETSGKVFYNDGGMQQDCIQLLASKGINSIRLRVWVNPTAGWCGLPDVVTMAKRARAMGMSVMIDLHNSDTWADPGHQATPAAWATQGIDSLVTTVYNYTYHVMDTLAKNGVTPAWVQVGNETNGGMMWNVGAFSTSSTSKANFARLLNSGYNAVKAISPTTLVIVHIANGNSNTVFRSVFDGLKANGGKWDVIGMSLYPTSSNWQSLTAQCMANMTDMVARYGSSVMISEIGLDVVPAPTCKKLMGDMIAKLRSLPNNKGLGIFYWEPESYNGWNGYSMGAFDLNGVPTVALDAFLENNAIAPGTNMLVNSGFETGATGTATPQGWTATGTSGCSYTSSGGGWNPDSTYYLTHYKSTAYQVRTYQMASVPNGHYSLTAWVARGNGQNVCQMYATGYDGIVQDSIIANIPYNNVWKQISIPDISVTNGLVTVGFYSNANAGNYMDIDSVRLINNTALPVTLAFYSAALQPSGAVKLSWKTATENNNKNYVIQRSVDGSHYFDIGTVPAQSGNGEREYAFVDAQPLMQTANYYQLVQEDMDGKKTELGIRIIKTGSLKKEFTVYPNPAARAVLISYPSVAGKQVTVQLLTLDGKKVMAAQCTPVNEQFTFDLPAVPKGFYLIQLLGNGIYQSRKLIIGQ